MFAWVVILIVMPDQNKLSTVKNLKLKSLDFNTFIK